MLNQETTKSHVGIPGFTIFIVFLVLKLTGVILWSWWWITCPLWIPFTVLCLVMGVAVLFLLTVGTISALFN